LAKETKSITVDITKKYVPFPNQVAFHRATQRHKHYGGGFGSGKSMALIGEMLTYLTYYPGIRGLLVRKTHDELIKSTLRDFEEFCPKEIIQSWNHGNQEIKFVNGSVLLYSMGDISKGAKEKIGHAQNLSFVAFDELHEIAEELYLLCESRIRQKPPPGQTPYPHRMISAANPNGHDWVWKKFIRNDRNKKMFFSVVTKTSDNPFLPDDFEKSLRENYPPHWVARYVDASYDEFTGLVYPEFDEKVHFIDKLPYIDSFDVNALEKKIGRRGLWFRAIDQGWTNPTVCLWAWVFPRVYDLKGELDEHSGDVYFVDEYYMSQRPVSFHADMIKSQTGNIKILITTIDPSCYNSDPRDGKNIANEYARYGVFVTPANHEVGAGLNRVREYLKIREMTGKPRVFFNNERMHHLREEIGAYVLKDLPAGQNRNAPEEPVKKNDHCMDAMRYMLVCIFDEEMRSYDHDPAAERERVRTCKRFGIDPSLGLDVSDWELPIEDKELLEIYEEM